MQKLFFPIFAAALFMGCGNQTSTTKPGESALAANPLRQEEAAKITGDVADLVDGLTLQIESNPQTLEMAAAEASGTKTVSDDNGGEVVIEWSRENDGAGVVRHERKLTFTNYTPSSETGSINKIVSGTLEYSLIRTQLNPDEIGLTRVLKGSAEIERTLEDESKNKSSLAFDIEFSRDADTGCVTVTGIVTRNGETTTMSQQKDLSRCPNGQNPSEE